MVERDEDRPAAPPADDDPDAPASAEEIAASQRLRDALATAGLGDRDESPSPELELALALRAAWGPPTLAEDESRAVLDAIPSAEEQAHAATLRHALEARRPPLATDGDAHHLAHALRSAFAPAALDKAEHERIVAAALAKLPAVAVDPPRLTSASATQGATEGGPGRALRRRQTVIRVAFGGFAAGLALAAAIALFITSAPPQEAPLARARSTQPLFAEPFKAGETSARIDRIAAARASDYRDNRFTAWGIR